MSARAVTDVVQHSFMPKAFDQALREALQADHVQVEKAGASPPRPRDPSLLSIPAGAGAGGQRATVHIRRQGSPFDERDERVARQIVGLMGDALSACTTDGDRATVFVEDTLEQLDLPFDTMRVKLGGGDNGHNGLRSLRSSLGTGDFHRVRVGIGRPPGRQDVADFVLSNYGSAEKKVLPFQVDKAADAVEALVTDGLERTQQAFNS